MSLLNVLVRGGRLNPPEPAASRLRPSTSRRCAVGVLQILESVPYFSGLYKDDLSKLAGISDVHEFNAGESLWKEGELVDWLLVVRGGKVDVIYRSQEHSEYVVDTVGPGDVIGWSALVAPYRHTATCTARTAGWGLRIRAEPVRMLCENNHELGYSILAQVVQALNRRLRSVRMLSLTDGALTPDASERQSGPGPG